MSPLCRRVAYLCRACFDCQTAALPRRLASHGCSRQRLARCSSARWPQMAGSGGCMRMRPSARGHSFGIGDIYLVVGLAHSSRQPSSQVLVGFQQSLLCTVIVFCFCRVVALSRRRWVIFGVQLFSFSAIGMCVCVYECWCLRGQFRPPPNPGLQAVLGGAASRLLLRGYRGRRVRCGDGSCQALGARLDDVSRV